MAMKCCTKLETVKERCPFVFQGHPSYFKVTRYKTSPILTQIGHFRTIGRSQLSNPSDLPCSCTGRSAGFSCHNVLDELSVTLTQGHSCGIDCEKFVCLHDNVKTSYPITEKLGSYILLVIIISWLDFGEILLEAYFGVQIFLQNFGCVFSRANNFLAICQECLVRLTQNEKEVHRLDTGWTMWHYPWRWPSIFQGQISK